MLYHLYAYNETDCILHGIASFTPIEKAKAEVHVILLPPGTQKMVCVTTNPAVTIHAVSADGAMFWGPEAFALTESETTHVYGVEHPREWPNPKTRQLPTVVA